MRQARGLTADPVLRLLVAFGVLLVPWFLAGPGGSVSTWVIQAAIDVFTVWLCLRLYRLPDIGRHARRFWAACTAGMTCSALGDSFQSVLVIAGRGHSVSIVQTGFVLAGMSTVVITMLFHPLGGAGRQRLRMWLDAATVLTAVAAFLWYFLLADQLRDGHAEGLFAAAATTAVMLLVTFGLIKLIFSSAAPFRRGPAIVGAIGVTGTGVAAPAATLIMGHASSGVLYLAQLLPCLIIPISLRMQEVLTRRDPGRRVRAERHGFSRLPYAAVAGTQVLLVIALIALNPDLRLWGVAGSVLISTGLVLARQQAAFQDNERLVTELSASREWFSALVQQASDLTVVVGAGNIILYASPAAARVLGAEAGVPSGTTVVPRIHPADLPIFATMHERLATEPTAESELRIVREDGTYRWLHVIATDLRDNPNVRGIVWNSRDITDARHLRDELRHQATHDTLTGLPNRALLQQRVRETDPGVPISMLLIDLDGFKLINDGHGHHAGDQVLIAVARRLLNVVGADGTAARLGGDEFAVLLPGADRARAAVLAERIAAVAAEPIQVPGAVVTVGASVGVAAGTPADADALLRDADEAMYRAKQSRRAAA